MERTWQQHPCDDSAVWTFYPWTDGDTRMMVWEVGCAGGEYQSLIGCPGVILAAHLLRLPSLPQHLLCIIQLADNVHRIEETNYLRNMGGKFACKAEAQ